MTPEYIIEICVAIVIAILGIAYPIIVDKISNIGDKYSSQYLPELFNNEFPQKKIACRINKKEYSISFFKLALYSTLLSLSLLIFAIPPLFGWDNWFVNNSAKLLVFFLSTLLTVFFIKWLDKVVLFNGKSTTLLNHTIKKYDSINDDKEIRVYYLKAINELAFYAIEKQDEHLQKTLIEFYYKVFARIRKEHDKTKPLIYPIDLYFLVNKLNIESTNIENKKLRVIENRAISGIWLLGQDSEELEISEETYIWLWRNINIICDKPRFIKKFWANSHQYFCYRLELIYPVYDKSYSQITNQLEVNKREEERKRFVEFHYALGGLMLYRKQYMVIKYFFEYTQSQPPTYELLPNTMTELFDWFEIFINENNRSGTPLDFKYYFPELDNLGNSGQVTYWICSYISILFIRQYSLVQNYTRQAHTELPLLSDNILELSNYLDNISIFEKCLKDILSNITLLEDIGFSSIVESKSSDFFLFIASYKDSIINKIGKQKLEAQLSTEKLCEFQRQSSLIITEAFREFDTILVVKDIEFLKSELKFSINGGSTLFSKSAFTEGEIPIENYDTIFAQTIATNRIKRLIPNSFVAARTQRYLLNRDNIVDALCKIIGNVSDVVIVGISISSQLRKILNENDFSNNLKEIPSTDYHLRDTLFVLRKRDLPAIEHLEPKEEEKVEFQLNPINKDLELYASVIDINLPENASIKSKWELDNETVNLDLKVQVAILFLSTIYWKNDREIIQIDLASEYKEQGIQTLLNDVNPLRIDQKKSL